MKITQYILCISFSLTSIYLQAQIAAKVESDTIFIQASSTEKVLNLGAEHEVFENLESLPGVQLRQYGTNTLASISINGSTPNQVSSFWNGVPINNFMVGQLDLSQLHPFLIDQLSISHSPEKTTNTQIGGQLHVSSDFTVGDPSLWTVIEKGSFGHRSIGLGHSYVSNKWAFKHRILSESTDNDFEYTIPNTDVRRTNTNAASKRTAGVFQARYHLNPSNTFKSSVWLQSHDRQLPPTIVQNESTASQKDHIARGHLTWNNQNNSFQNEHSISFSKDRILYTASLSSAAILSEFDQGTLQGKVKKSTEKKEWFLAYRSSHLRADINSYETVVNENRTEVSGFFKINSSSLSWSHQLYVKARDFEQFLPGGQSTLSYITSPSLNLSLIVGRRVRWPSLNELYWRPGGQESLSPEIGWESILEGHWTPQPNIVISSRAYHKKIDNQILWSFGDNTSFWEAYNIESVHSTGANLTTRYIGSSLEIRLSYDFNRSIFLEDLNFPKISAGDQQWYMPLHQLQHTLAYSFSHFEIRWDGQWSSSSRGINANISEYWVQDVSLTGKYSIMGIENEWNLLCNNIFDAYYEIIERRPLPGRQFILRYLIKI